MNVSRLLIAIALVAISAVAGCAAPTPTPPPPTAAPPPTAVPPTAAPVAPAAASITLNLGAGRDGDQAGTATLTVKGDETEVTLNIKPGAAGVAQPVHIHEGACPVPGGVKFPLTNVADGKSTTMVKAKLADLLTGGFAINAHLSGAEASKYVACGNIPAGAVFALNKGRDADETPATVVLLDKSGKTDVTVFKKPGAAGAAQPAHIHEGACPGVGGVKFPLTNVVDGKSATTVDAKLADLLAGNLSVNVHKSGTDAAVYVACGTLGSRSTY